MKTLFYFRGRDGENFEVFANDLKEAENELRRLMNNLPINPPRLTLITQNHSCPKCSCHATECNYVS